MVPGSVWCRHQRRLGQRLGRSVRMVQQRCNGPRSRGAEYGRRGTQALPAMWTAFCWWANQHNQHRDTPRQGAELHMLWEAVLPNVCSDASARCARVVSARRPVGAAQWRLLPWAAGAGHRRWRMAGRTHGRRGSTVAIRNATVCRQKGCPAKHVIEGRGREMLGEQTSARAGAMLTRTE